jgi:hypothetical protein
MKNHLFQYTQRFLGQIPADRVVDIQAGRAGFHRLPRAAAAAAAV